MLKITAGQEALWTPVAQTMRDNSAEMEKLAVAKKAQSPTSMTALDDMANYQAFRAGACRWLEEARRNLRDALRLDAR